MENMKLKVVYGDVVLGVHGEGFDYLFSYQTGGMESLVLDGKEWLYRTPKPAFWRAVTDNDRGNGFPARSGMWLAADMFSFCREIEVSVDGTVIPLPTAPENNRFGGTKEADRVKIRFVYQTVTVPAADVEVAYEVTADGKIRVDVCYHGKKGLPELPVFGLRLVMPTKALGFCYQGLSGETYPDRMAGGIPGIYEIEGLPMTKYLVPQDCGMHMETDWLEIYRDSVLNRADKEPGRFGIRIGSIDKKFAFSCLPYTPQEIENATHHEELPPERRTVLTVCGAVRGVGGIDSWGADVEPEYHIDAEQELAFSFRIEPLSHNV